MKVKQNCGFCWFNGWLTRTSQSNSVSIIAYKFGEQTSFRLCTGVELVLHIIDLKKRQNLLSVLLASVM